MNNFNQFVSSVACFPLKRADEFVANERVALKLHPIGYYLESTALMLKSNRALAQDMLEKLPLSMKGPQPSIGLDYQRIVQLNNLLYVIIPNHDGEFSEDLQCLGLLHDAMEALDAIDQYIPHLISSGAASLAQYIDDIVNKINAHIQIYDQIIERVGACEAQLISTLPKIPQAEFKVSYQIASTLSAFDQFRIELVYMSSNNALVDTATLQQLKQWIEHCGLLSKSLLGLKQEKSDSIASTASSILGQLSLITQVVEQCYDYLQQSEDFAKCTASLNTLTRILNEIVTKAVSKDVRSVLKSYNTAYLTQKPLDNLLKDSTDILTSLAERVAKIHPNLTYVYNSLNCVSQTCASDRESAALTISSILRFASFILPDGNVGEELLNTLAKKISTITKSIFKESRKLINETNEVVESNLEFFEGRIINEYNYVYTIAKSVDEFDIEAQDFGIQQQLFFNSLCSIQIPLKNLSASCQDQETKSQLNKMLDSFQKISNNFIKWLGQYQLCICSIILQRAVNICGILSFPINLLCSIGHQFSIHNLTQTIDCIYSICASSPKVLLADYQDIVNLITYFTDVSKNLSEYTKTISQCTSSPFYVIFQQASDAISKATSNLSSLSNLYAPFIFNDSDSLINTLNGHISLAINLYQELNQLMQDEGQNLAFYSSTDYTLILKIYYFIANNSNLAPSLIPINEILKSNFDVVWGSIVKIAEGRKPEEPMHLTNYSGLVIKSLNELFITLQTFTQPSLEYEIPDDIQEIRRFDQLANSLHTSQLKNFSLYFIRIMKSSTVPDVRNTLVQWFDATKAQPIAIIEGVNSLSEEINKLLTSTSGKTKFIELYTLLSVSLATNENSFGKTIAPLLLNQHKELVKIVYGFLESNRSTQVQLLNIYSCLREIGAFVHLSKLKQKEMDDYHVDIIKKVISSLHALRSSKQKQLNDILGAINSIASLHTFYSVNPPDYDLELLEISKHIINESATKQIYDSSISKIAKCLLSLVPSQYEALDRIRDTDTVCDFVYDKAEAFREDVNKVINYAKTHHGEENELIESLSKMVLYSSDAAILTMHSLMLAGLVFSPLSGHFVECFSEMLIHLGTFCNQSIKLPNQPNDDFSLELRRLNRRITKQFDNFINIVENPQRSSGEVSAFDSTKHQMLANLSTVMVQIARLNSLASVALVPEMYDETRAEIADNINDSMSQLKKSVAVVRSKAVGKSSNEISNLLKQLEKQIMSLISASENLSFGKCFTPSPLATPCNDVCQVTLKMATIGQGLTDRIIIEPDPQAAAQVPEDFVVPPLPKDKLPVNDTYQNLVLVNVQTEKVSGEFKSITDTPLAGSKELLDSMAKLREAGVEFTEKSLLMAVATVDSRYQVEQQTAIHAFTRALNDVQNAMKNRLMRKPQFEAEMEEAIINFNTCMNKCMKLAETASKIQGDDFEDDSLDDVTRELNATAKAIEKMSEKLKEFEEQVKAEVAEAETEQVDRPDIQADAGSLPAFLITTANPILAAAQRILKRAQEITMELIHKFGRIENEKGLIRSAQDLSEAAELLIICAEILISGKDPDAEFKAISAARIIKASVASLVAQVLVKGGDPEGIMNAQVKIIVGLTDTIIQRAEAIVDEKLTEEEKKRPVKRGNNPMIQRLNMQSIVNDNRKNLQNEESKLYQFRRKTAAS